MSAPTAATAADTGATASVALQTARADARRWYWQRISAMVLALCVVVHIAVMVYAVRGGLSGAEILARTRGSIAFGAFYTVFVLACVAHVPTGLMNIAVEWLRWPARRALLAGRLVALLLLVTGLRAVHAVVVG